MKDLRKRKGHLLYGVNNEPLPAVVSYHGGVKVGKSDPGHIMETCKTVLHAFVRLNDAIAQNDGKLSLSNSFITMPPQGGERLIVEYRLMDNSPRYVVMSALELSVFYLGSYVDQLIVHSYANAKCVIRCNDYTVYAANVIPLDEISSVDAFIRDLDHVEFRTKHGIFCVTQTYAQIPYKDDFGIRYFDLFQLTELINK